MKKFIYSMKSASNHGKGLKKENVGDYEEALGYFQQSLKNADKSGDVSLIPFELEAIARMYFKMGKMKDAEEAGRKSLEKYEEIIHYGSTVEDGIKRVKEILDSI